MLPGKNFQEMQTYKNARELLNSRAFIVTMFSYHVSGDVFCSGTDDLSAQKSQGGPQGRQ